MQLKATKCEVKSMAPHTKYTVEREASGKLDKLASSLILLWLKKTTLEDVSTPVKALSKVLMFVCD